MNGLIICSGIVPGIDCRVLGLSCLGPSFSPLFEDMCYISPSPVTGLNELLVKHMLKVWWVGVRMLQALGLSPEKAGVRDKNAKSLTLVSCLGWVGQEEANESRI